MTVRRNDPKLQSLNQPAATSLDDVRTALGRLFARIEMLEKGIALRPR